MKYSILHIALFALEIAAGWEPSSTTAIFPSAVQTGPINPKYTLAKNQSLDTPMLDRINSTAFEWWLYEFISPDAHSSVTLGFWTQAPDVQPELSVVVPGTVDFITIFGSFANDTIFGAALPAREAVVKTSPDGLTGDFKGTGVSWASEGDWNGNNYTISFDSYPAGITGSLKLKSLSPAHSSCGTPVPGESLEAIPNYGWLEVVPNGAGVVDLAINGSALQFSGFGYHDRGWGVGTADEQTAGWTFGNGRLGPYALNWWVNISPSGEVYSTGYVTLNDKVINSACGNVQVTSPNWEKELHVEWDFGDGCIFAIDAKPNVNIISTEKFFSWVGVMEGGIVGETNYTGAIYVQGRILPDST